MGKNKPGTWNPTPPEYRDNWEAKNSSNKGYTYAQYNTGLINRGKPQRQFPDEAYSTRKPGGITKQPPLTNMAGVTLTLPGHIHDLHIKDLVDEHNKRFNPTTPIPVTPSTTPKAAIIHAQESDSENSVYGDSQGTSHVSDTQESRKRPLEVDEETPSQVAKQVHDYVMASNSRSEPMEEGAAANPILDKLPNTPVAGKNYSGALASTPGVGSIWIDKPINYTPTMKMRYEKHWVMVSFGVAPINFKVDDICQIPQPLMEVPWDRAFFYLNPSQFANLPPGTHAKSCGIKIQYWNIRSAFNTGEGMSTIATINQNKFGVIAKGLNFKGLGVNRHLTVGSDMKTTAVGAVDYNAIDLDYYGYDQSNVKFNTHVPACQFGRPMHLANYFCAETVNNDYYVGPPAHDVKIGWQDLTPHYTKFDANQTIGADILEHSYNFQMAPITVPHRPIWPVPQTEIKQTIGNNTVERLTQTIKDIGPIKDSTAVEETSVSVDGAYKRLKAKLSRLSLLEQKQKIFRGQASHTVGSVMPSLHIGVSPVIKLDAGLGTYTADSWVDTQGHYEIDTWIELEASHPTHYSHPDYLNINPQSMILTTGKTLSNDQMLFNGLYHEG